MTQLARRIVLTAGTCLAAGLARAAPASAPPVAVIGAALPLSGDTSLIGDECLRGIQLAVEAMNQAGGPVAVTAADTFDQSRAAGAVNALINQGHANILLGAGASGLSFSASAAAELAQVPFIELDAPADGITARGFRFLLRTGPTTSMIGAQAVSAVQKRYPGRKIGLLFNTGAADGAAAAAILAYAAAAKLPIPLAMGYPEDVTDLYDAAGRLKRAGAAIVLHAAGPSDVLAFFAAMRAQAWQPEAVLGCGDGYLLRDTELALGPDFDGTLVVGAPYYPPDAVSIAAAYQARFGMAPRAPDSLTAYVGAKLVFDTLASVNGDPAKLLDAMRKADVPLGGLENGFGAAFDRNGQNTRSFVTLQRWKDGQLAEA